VASDYYDDLKLDNAILQAQTDSYRRIRNTLRYLIGNLYEFKEDEKIDIAEFPELEKFILHRLWEIDQTIQNCISSYNFHLMFTTLLNFCSNDLSSFYFDIRKDAIYCDSFNSKKRRAARTLLDILFNYIVRWLAPFLVFTCEEAWKSKGNGISIHLEEFFKTDIKFKNDVIAKKWEQVKEVRKVITGALEVKRADKTIGSSLESHIEIYLSKEINSIIENIDMAEIAITSSATIMTGDNHSSGFSLDDIKDIVVDVKKSKGKKCKRCWKFDSEINSSDICNRCFVVIQK
jgi:isoleucyl-tRNA synthetase